MTTLATLFAALMMYIPEVGTAVRTTVSAARIILGSSDKSCDKVWMM